MNPTVLIVLFIVTASIGIVQLTLVLNDKKRPIFLVGAHGFFAITGISLLTFYGSASVGMWSASFNISFWVFWIAVMIGAFMFVRDKLLRVGIPKWMPFVHGGAALAGLVALIIYALGG